MFFFCVSIIRMQEKNGLKVLEIKIKDVEQHKNIDEEERGIVQEMVNDGKKYFNNGNDYCINQ